MPPNGNNKRRRVEGICSQYRAEPDTGGMYGYESIAASFEKEWHSETHERRVVDPLGLFGPPRRTTAAAPPPTPGRSLFTVDQRLPAGYRIPKMRDADSKEEAATVAAKRQRRPENTSQHRGKENGRQKTAETRRRRPEEKTTGSSPPTGPPAMPPLIQRSEFRDITEEQWTALQRVQNVCVRLSIPPDERAGLQRALLHLSEVMNAKPSMADAATGPATPQRTTSATTSLPAKKKTSRRARLRAQRLRLLASQNKYPEYPKSTALTSTGAGTVA